MFCRFLLYSKVTPLCVCVCVCVCACTFFSFFLFLLFRASLMPYGSSQARSRIGATSILPQLQQHWIRATSTTYTAALGNARSLTLWARPGIRPGYSWILVQFPLHHHRNSLHIIFLISSSLVFYHKWLDIVPCAVQQDPMEQLVFLSLAKFWL